MSAPQLGSLVYKDHRGIFGLDGDFWVEGSKSVMEESSKLSFR